MFNEVVFAGWLVDEADTQMMKMTKGEVVLCVTEEVFVSV